MLRHSILRGLAIILPLGLLACAKDAGVDILADYEEVRASTILEAPSARPGLCAPDNRDCVVRGKYLVELLGCGACHTDGALVGEPDRQRALAGSRTGIAQSNPLGDQRPGVIYPPNITPDKETGIGLWSDQQIADAIRLGIGRHGSKRIAAMPWAGYARISADDTEAIVGYLRSIDPVVHKVPDEVNPGQLATSPFVYFGVYRSRR